jgi:hypothetical protein
VGECFSPPVLALLTLIVTPTVAAFGIIYRDLRRSSNEQIADLIGERDDLLKRVLGSTHVAHEATREIRGAAGGKRRS